MHAAAGQGAVAGRRPSRSSQQARKNFCAAAAGPESARPGERCAVLYAQVPRRQDHQQAHGALQGPDTDRPRVLRSHALTDTSKFSLPHCIRNFFCL